MELGIRLSFVKTSEFRGGGGSWNPKPPLITPLLVLCGANHRLVAACVTCVSFPRLNMDLASFSDRRTEKHPERATDSRVGGGGCQTAHPSPQFCIHDNIMVLRCLSFTADQLLKSADWNFKNVITKECLDTVGYATTNGIGSRTSFVIASVRSSVYWNMCI
jgi:hypothetical protein